MDHQLAVRHTRRSPNCRRHPRARDAGSTALRWAAQARSMLKGSARSASTASVTVAKLSSDVLHPSRQREVGLAGTGLGYCELGEVEQIGDQALLVHAVGAADLVARDDDAAVLRRPFRRISDRPRHCASCRPGRPRDWTNMSSCQSMLRPVITRLSVADIERSRAGECGAGRPCANEHGQVEIPETKPCSFLFFLFCPARSHRKRARMSTLFSTPILSNVDASHGLRPAVRPVNRNVQELRLDVELADGAERRQRRRHR